ncbi:hypothetical protein [Tunicatimonas pelagia]|uniref:hypothetical protein n=1 Tax=Tunicatimonas pelagia TaxID=931531 RepID=UPI0026663C14|nr:hypothetical protein [Tunicatimonas pelagia]WKN44055.1 hypothetical protein P0M28_03615 [Tunicatimonas pelagia]
MKKISFSVVVILLIGLSGCMGVRPASSGGRAGKLYESFLREGGVMQYYIKPLTFSSSQEKAEVDFVYRSNFSPDSLVTCNFSLLLPDTFRDLTATEAGFQTEEVVSLEEVQKLYADSGKSKYHVRYSAKMRYEEFLKLLTAKDVSFQFKAKEHSTNMSAPTKTERHIADLYQQLF